MPTNSLTIPVPGSKSIKLTCLFLLFPLFFFGQSLTGLWIGTVSNDSTTVRKDQSFEIALTEYKGKVYGYSRSEFIVDDVLYYIVKRVSGTIEGDICEVTDDEIISYNFPKLLDKKVKVTSTFRRDKSDSTWYLAGKWKTNVTKKYYSVSGRVDLEEEKDLTASKIFPHLEELKLADAIAFYKERKEGQPIVKIARPERAGSALSPVISPVSSDAIAVTDKPIVSKNNTQPVTPSSATTLGKTSEEENSNDLAVIKRADNTDKTTIQEIPSSKTTITPSSTGATTAVKSEPVAGKKDVVAGPATPGLNSLVTTDTEKKENAAAKQDVVVNTNNVTKENDLVKNNNSVAADKKVNTPVKQDAATNPVAKTGTAPVNTTAKDNNTVKTNSTAAVTDKKESGATVKQDLASNTKTVAKTGTAPANNTIVKDNGFVKNNNNVAATDKKENNTPVKQDVTAASKTGPANNTVAENKIVKTDAPLTPLKPEMKAPSVDVTLKAAIIAGRKSEFSQQVNFKSDSLQVALYDNGEIDGDTVSVFMNGEVIMAKQGLKSSAIRKTIYLEPGQDEFTLVLFAENLGKYPPNTGLLVVRDGDDVYNLRFSSDFEKNTGIVFRRKK